MKTDKTFLCLKLALKELLNLNQTVKNSTDHLPELIIICKDIHKPNKISKEFYKSIQKIRIHIIF